MKCALCQDLIQQRLDGIDSAEAPEMARHLVECPRCASLHEASRRLSAGLLRMTPLCPPHALTDRVVAAVLADQRAQRKRRWLRIGMSALAASLLLGVAVGLHAHGWLTFGKDR